METAASPPEELRYHDAYLDTHKGGSRSKRLELMANSNRANRVARQGAKWQPTQPMLLEHLLRRLLMPSKGSREEGNHRPQMLEKSPMSTPSIWLRISAATYLLPKETPR